MPQLPSGRHLAIDALPFEQLLQKATTDLGKSIPEVMSIRTTDDLAAYLRFVWLEPVEDSHPQALKFLPYSSSPPTAMQSVPSSHTVADWDAFAATLSSADAEACQEFLRSERHHQLRLQLMEQAKEMQTWLLEHPKDIVRVMAGWAQAGVHPLQTGEAEQGFWEGAFDLLEPPDDVDSQPDAAPEDAPEAETALGHGGHWRAVGAEGEEIMHLMRQVIQQTLEKHAYSPLWQPAEGIQRCEYRPLTRPDLSLAVIIGQPSPDEDWQVLSGFPVAERTSAWTLKIEALRDAYGPFEGMVEGTAASGHGLCWFVPRFGPELAAWQHCLAAGSAQVKLAGIALGMAPYPAEPMIIREGPAVEIRRQELRDEGRHAEAEDPNLTITFITSCLRSLFSTFHDHCEFVGKILYVDEITPEGIQPGWWVQLECLPEAGENPRSLPVLVFPPALEPGYIPQMGDLVSGILWMQGSEPVPVDETILESSPPPASPK